MLEMLKERKAALEAQGKKGFTLMEMLIVIAIIAILIAIAIPLFMQQLARAQAATDEANIRSGYAQVQTELMLNNDPEDSYTLMVDGTVDAGGTPYETKGTNESLDEDVLIGGLKVEWDAKENITYTIGTDSNGNPTIESIGA